MSLNDVYLISQIIAAIALVASLLFVGLQVRQANRMMREAAIRNHAEKLQSVSRAMFEVPIMAPLLDKAIGGLDALTPVERMQFVNMISWVLRIFEELHRQYEAGEIDKAQWAANSRVWARTVKSPGPRAVYELRRDNHAPKFQAYLDDLLTRIDDKPLY
jgi:hypothetical protein